MPHSVLHSQRHLCAFLRESGTDCEFRLTCKFGRARRPRRAVGRVALQCDRRTWESATRDHEPDGRGNPGGGCARPPDTKTRLRRDTKTGQPLVEARKGSRGVLECLIAEIGRLFHTEPRRTRSFHLAVARDAHRSGVGRAETKEARLRETRKDSKRRDARKCVRQFAQCSTTALGYAAKLTRSPSRLSVRRR